MIIAPLVACFFALIGKGDIMMVVSAATTAHKVWSEWIEYEDLRFQIQRMYLVSTMVGGPFIVTNDPKYEPYVYADAVVRAQTGMLRKTAKPRSPAVQRPRPAH